ITRLCTTSLSTWFNEAFSNKIPFSCTRFVLFFLLFFLHTRFVLFFLHTEISVSAVRGAKADQTRENRERHDWMDFSDSRVSAIAPKGRTTHAMVDFVARGSLCRFSWFVGVKPIDEDLAFWMQHDYVTGTTGTEPA